MEVNRRWAAQVEGLTVRFGDFTAVDGISFRVAPGEIFGFLGANGAGKTTTIRVLCGLLVPTAGNVKVAGLDLRDGLIPVKKKVGYMSQRFTLYENMTVEENLSFAAALRKMSSRELAERVRHLFEKVGFDRPANTFVRDLPGGYKQELSLVAAMLHDPEIVFLDEPTAGVAPAARARFWRLIRSIADAGKTVFVTTHYLDEAEQCGRIALMSEGRLIALDSPAQLKASAFPEPLVELDPGPGAGQQWLECARREAIRELKPYGRRWHASVANADAAERLSRTLAPSVAVRVIHPSLEDVFIRLVEGKQ